MKILTDHNMITFSDGRIFIDVARGCGNGCKYCYCQDKNEPQLVFDQETIIKTVQSIFCDNRFYKGKNGTLVSLCPHTEPFKSCDSTMAIISLIELFLPYGNRIQISTKEVIPDIFIDKIRKTKMDIEQLTLFVSVSSLNSYKIDEPFAADIQDRLNNIDRLNNSKINNCLYIKPYLMQEDEIDARAEA